jgi:hypothetical protein
MKLLLILTTSFQIIFGEDYKKAVDFNNKYHNHYLKYATQYNCDVNLLKSIVFPELVRYSLLRDFIETKALELMYINELTDVDFSIGHFQMKPSFATAVEEYIIRNKIPGFHALTGFKESNKRKERIERLKSLDGQLLYLVAFFKITEHRFRNICFLSDKEKMRFYFTAFNSGFNLPENSIKKMAEENFFPYGPKVNTPQYNYSEIAFDYYLNHLKKEAL